MQKCLGNWGEFSVANSGHNFAQLIAWHKWQPVEPCFLGELAKGLQWNLPWIAIKKLTFSFHLLALATQVHPVYKFCKIHLFDGHHSSIKIL
jgi:hypothetical protein